MTADGVRDELKATEGVERGHVGCEGRPPSAKASSFLPQRPHIPTHAQERPSTMRATSMSIIEPSKDGGYLLIEDHDS